MSIFCSYVQLKKKLSYSGMKWNFRLCDEFSPPSELSKNVDEVNVDEVQSVQEEEYENSHCEL